VKVKAMAYKWDEERGVVAIGANNTMQAIQLLHGPASLDFRRKCGELLVRALNRDVAASTRKRKGRVK
jgi:hypothetical protein